MKSKRKTRTPQRFHEAKRCRESWNMEIGSPSSGKVQGPTQFDEMNVLENPTINVNGEVFVEKPYACFEIRIYMDKSLLFTDKEKGPIIGQLSLGKGELFMKDVLQHHHRKVANDKLALNLNVYGKTCGECLQAEFSMKDNAIDNGNDSNCKKQHIIWKGPLLMSYMIIRSLQKVVKEKIVQLVACLPERDMEDKILDLYIELLTLQNQGRPLASDNFEKTFPNKHLFFLMSTFFKDLKAISSPQTMNGFRYTGEEIQSLYDCIKKYDNKEWELANSCLDDDVLSTGSVECSYVQEDLVINDNDLSNVNNLSEKFQPLEEDNSEQSYSCLKDEDFNELQNGFENTNDNNKSLIPVLRHYQQAAVDWMIMKENNDTYEDNQQNFWTKLSCIDGRIIYYNKCTGRITTKIAHEPLPRGGILADEMGLGKTVEVLALILNNPRKDRFIADRRKNLEGVGFASFTRDKMKDRDKLNRKTGNENCNNGVLCSATNTMGTGLHTAISIDDFKQQSIESENIHDQNNMTTSTNNGYSPGYAMKTDVEVLTGAARKNLLMTNVCPSNIYFQKLDQKFMPNGDCNKEIIHDATCSGNESELASNNEFFPGMKSLDLQSPVISCCTDLPKLPLEEVDKHISLAGVPSSVDSKTTFSCCVCGQKAKQGSECSTLKCSCCEARMDVDCAGLNGSSLHNVRCPECATGEIIETHCTLIVSPEAIVYQWADEIQKHVRNGALKHLLYKGVAKDGFMQPAVLAEYDVIITTYATLRADFNHVKAEEGKSRSLRHHKKYAVIPSPLMSLRFWRICLDEAQMIQYTTTKTAEMAVKIKGNHRWCVTGTPVQRGLEDIYGMLLFLGVSPYSVKVWWKKLLYEPLIGGDRKPLFDLLSSIMWRTEKKDVIDQINLPKQTEQLNYVKLGPVERHFYQRQEEMCTANAVKEINKWNDKATALSALDKHSLHKLLGPLLRLRQACCHPHIVRGGILSIQQSHLSMEKLLEGLIAKAKIECQEAHRQLMSAMNGLAGIDLIEKKVSDAIDKYRDAMRSWAVHKDIFKTDLLQKLHTMKNLADALKETNSCSHALSDEKLPEEVKDLSDDYIKKATAKVVLAQNQLETINVDIENLKESINRKNSWWMTVLNYFQLSRADQNGDVVGKIKDEVNSRFSGAKSICNNFSTIQGLSFIIQSKLDGLMALRERLLQALDNLKCEPTKEMINTTAECCLRPAEDSDSPRCEFCCVDDLFTEYENTIFTHRGMTEKGVEKDENKRFGGLRAETELDVVLKIILSISRQSFFDDALRDDAKSHLNFLDLMKQEFKTLRNLWFALHQRISSYDELEMSALRLRLRYPGEKTKERYIIDYHELKSQRLKNQSDQIIAENELKRKKGQLFYLKNLEKAQKNLNGFNPDLCPICTKVLGHEWAVFPCGHCFCCDCVYVIERQHSGKFNQTSKGLKVKCALCRTQTLTESISYVMLNDEETTNDSHIKVNGNYSMKVEAITRRILEIVRIEPDGKIIVFSTWLDVLEIISKALDENNIIYKYGASNRKRFQSCLADFKKMDAVKVLLLPLKSGAKGLNIIEANHVILVEPTLNPANELQAIGRVHRIGQTKPTFVHRFLVNETVEERILHLLQNRSTSSTTNDDTLETLTIADLTTLMSSKSNDVLEEI